MPITYKLSLKVDDTLLAILLLMGLPETYESVIIRLEMSGARMTADAIKATILQEVKVCNDPKSCGAVIVRSSVSSGRSNPRSQARSTSSVSG